MAIVRTDSLDDPGLAPFVALTDHELRRSLEAEHGLFIAESSKVVRSALQAGVRPISFLLEERRLPPMEGLLAMAGEDVPVYAMGRERLSQLVGYPHNRGVLCAMERPAPRDPAEVLDGARCVAVIEGVTDTTNVGAIFRSASALGADGILLTPTCADPLARRCVRVSMGTVFSVPWARISPWPEGGMDVIHGAGLSTVACALSPDAMELGDPRVHGIGPCALMFGTEGDGLAADTVAAADYVVRIPMAHGVDSLNVAAASAVFFWEFLR